MKISTINSAKYEIRQESLLKNAIIIQETQEVNIINIIIIIKKEETITIRETTIKRYINYINKFNLDNEYNFDLNYNEL